MAETRYTREHLWVRLEDDGTVTVGLTEYGQDTLGDAGFVELPELHRELVEGESCAVVEGAGGPMDIFSPLEGSVSELNELVVDEPGLINRDAEGEAWLFRMEIEDQDEEFDALLDDAAYESFVEGL